MYLIPTTLLVHPFVQVRFFHDRRGCSVHAGCRPVPR
jgi:hypothetical protein